MFFPANFKNCLYNKAMSTALPPSQTAAAPAKKQKLTADSLSANSTQIAQPTTSGDEGGASQAAPQVKQKRPRESGTEKPMSKKSAVTQQQQPAVAADSSEDEVPEGFAQVPGNGAPQGTLDIQASLCVDPENPEFMDTYFQETLKAMKDQPNLVLSYYPDDPNGPAKGYRLQVKSLGFDFQGPHQKWPGQFSTIAMSKVNVNQPYVKPRTASGWFVSKK